jgi:hypothetical protein
MQGHVSESQFSIASLDNTLLRRVLHKSLVHSPKAQYDNRDWEVSGGHVTRDVFYSVIDALDFPA